MKLNDFNYEIPEELIAQYPAEKRDESRLMVLERETESISHHIFKEIKHFLGQGDVLVINETKVLPARLLGKKETGANVELFLLQPEEDEDIWKVLVKPGKRIKVGHTLIFGDGALIAEIIGRGERGVRYVKFTYKGGFYDIIEDIARVPLPPYIHREANRQDSKTYQTVYARARGAVAAPTAGLHFTEDLLSDIQVRGVRIAPVVLHVGLGTFRPVSHSDPTKHKMHSEYYEMPAETANIINQAKEQGNRVIAVGTTSVRTLETVADDAGYVSADKGMTDIYIYPPYNFRCVDGLITNFHLPKSTLLMLVSAFAGRNFILNAYQEAIEKRYRFYSYGDAMFIC